jgi:hypothetical protein
MSEFNISQAQLGLLWHTLGLRPEFRDRRQSYRNRFLAGPGHDDVPDLEALVTAGLMASRKPPAVCDQSEILYYATESGEKFAIAKMPPAPKLNKFEEYLDVSECYDNFAQFLGINQPMFQQRGEWKAREYRMVRYHWGSVYRRTWRHYDFSSWSPYEPLDVAGEWASNMKAAKASYKEALKKHLSDERAKRRMSQIAAA